MDKATTEALLNKVREGVLFYLKGDLLVLGGAIAVATLLKLEKTEIISIAVMYLWPLVGLGILVAMGMTIESITTTTVVSDDLQKNQKNSSAIRLFYKVYVMLQVFSLAFLFGGVAKYLDWVGTP